MRVRLGKLPPDFNNTSVKLSKPVNWLFTQLMSRERWPLLRAVDTVHEDLTLDEVAQIRFNLQVPIVGAERRTVGEHRITKPPEQV